MRTAKSDMGKIAHFRVAYSRPPQENNQQKQGAVTMVWKDPGMWGWLPFMAGSVGQSGIDVRRVVEALLIAGITGTLVMWGTTKVLEERIAVLQRDIQGVQTEIRELRRDVYMPRSGLRHDVPESLSRPH